MPPRRLVRRLLQLAMLVGVVTVRGELFGGTACNDTGPGNGLACHRGEEEPDPPRFRLPVMVR